MQSIVSDVEQGQRMELMVTFENTGDSWTICEIEGVKAPGYDDKAKLPQRPTNGGQFGQAYTQTMTGGANGTT